MNPDDVLPQIDPEDGFMKMEQSVNYWANDPNNLLKQALGQIMWVAWSASHGCSLALDLGSTGWLRFCAATTLLQNKRPTSSLEIIPSLNWNYGPLLGRKPLVEKLLNTQIKYDKVQWSKMKYNETAGILMLDTCFVMIKIHFFTTRRNVKLS